MKTDKTNKDKTENQIQTATAIATGNKTKITNQETITTVIAITNAKMLQPSMMP